VAVMDVYVRVSRVGDREGEAYRSPQIQLAHVENWAKLNEVEIGWVVTDEDVSGTKPVEERGLEQLIRRAEEGASEGVMVYRIDRFGRDALEVLFAIRRLTGAKARLVSVGEGLDSSTDVGRLLIGFIVNLAEYHLSMIRSGWDASARGAVNSGIHVASRAPLGYLRQDQAAPTYDSRGKLIRDGRLVPDPASAAIVTEAFTLRVGGASHGKIVEYLEAALRRGVAKSTVTAMLRNRAYLGEARGPGEGNVKVGAHEPLVDEETFDRVQVRAGTRSTKDGSVSSQAILGGLITCASCGHKLRVLGSPKGGASYVCHAKYAGGNCAEPAAARVKLVDAHVADLMAGAWDEVTARSADSAQRFVEARERVAKLEAEYDTLSNDPELVLGLGAERFKDLLLKANSSVLEARRQLWDLDDPGVGDVPVVYVDGQPWLYEQFGDDPARDKQHMRQHIATVTLAKADPARRRWQPIAERVDVRWHGQDA